MVAVSLFLHNNQCAQVTSFTTSNREELFSKGNLMGKNKLETRKRFQPGPHGGCEALLYEFREPPLQSDDEDDLPSASGQPYPRTVLIAAETVDEALVYLRFHSQGFNVHTVKCLGVILMVSGSPAD
jgi:hypothetical protein